MLSILKTNNPDDGFTMFEILVVMGIIAVVAALIVPRLGGTIYNLKLRSAVRKTSAVLRYIRSVAVTSQQEQRVSFMLKEDPEEKDYYKYNKVTRKSRDQHEGEFYKEDEEGLQDSPEELKQEARKVELDARISLSWRDGTDMGWEEEGRYEIIFSPRGFASGGEIRFALSGGKRAYILKIDPVTGRAKISTGEE